MRLPSVDPIPIDANDLTDDASLKRRVDPLSLNTYDPDLARWANCGAINTFGLENVSDGSPVLNDFAFKWCFGLTKLDDGDKNGLAPSSLSFSADKITNFLADADFRIPFGVAFGDDFGECLALNEISLSPYFGVNVWLSYRAFVCESILNHLLPTDALWVSINYRVFLPLLIRIIHSQSDVH